MQRLRSTFKRSRTPTGAEMKSQSSLEVPKQVRSASFDEIQLEAKRQDAGGREMQLSNREGRSSCGTRTTSSSSSSCSPARSWQDSKRLPAMLRVPQLQSGQRSKSFDVCERTSLLGGGTATGPSSSSSSQRQKQLSSMGRSSVSSGSSGRGKYERETPLIQLSGCYHCACVEEYKNLYLRKQDDDYDDDEDRDSLRDDADKYEVASGGRGEDDDSGGVDDEDEDADDDDDVNVEVDDDEEIGDASPGRGSCQEDDYDPTDVGAAEIGGRNSAGWSGIDDHEDRRRDGSPEIRVTLTTHNYYYYERSTSEIDTGSSDGSEVRQSDFVSCDRQQRRRSVASPRLSRQEALTSFPPELPSIRGDYDVTEDDESPQTNADDDDDDDDDDASSRSRQYDTSSRSDDNKTKQLVVRDIFLTVPELKRDRAASVDSCFNNNKNGKNANCMGGSGDGFSLTVPQQSIRSKSVDIVLPTEAQTRYTALLPTNETRLSRGAREEGGPSGNQREPRSTPDWGNDAINGEHLWVPTAASGDFCYMNDCSKHGPRVKCAACRVVVHLLCASSLSFECKPSFRDVGVRQYREQTSTHHHWVHRRSQKGKCSNCGKAFQSKLSFSSKEIVAVSCSWCKAAYHNKEACFNVQKIGENCELGSHASIVVPPSWIVKLPRKGSFKSSLRKSPRRKKSGGGSGASSRRKGKEKDKEKDDKDQGKMWIVKPIPTSSIRPVIVFINPKSGGNQGAKLLQKFQWHLNPRQVFDLTQGGPKMGLELFQKVPNLRVLACGGDGTVGWVLSILDQIGVNPSPAVGVLPLGTGNDLARALGWGGGYTDEPIGKILSNIGESETTLLDRWQVSVERNQDAGNDEDGSKGKENLPLNVVNNYFSLGVDAHIALEFHEAREAHPEKFNSRLRNKMFYGQMGGKDLVRRKWKDLSEFVTLECDGQDMTPKLKEHRVHAIVFLNIASYGGGTHPWGAASGTKEPSTEDGLIEVVGLTTYQLPLLQAGGHGTCISQCSKAKLITTRTIPMQVDGEACRLLPSIIEMSLLNKATMLAKRRSTSKPQQNSAKLEGLKLPIMRIGMSDYEAYHSDKDRLKKAAVPWLAGPLDLDATTDLEALRKILSKEQPMDSCCFLDSCTAERFFRIDRAQEQLHYVTDVAVEAVYVLEEGPSSISNEADAGRNNHPEPETAQASPSEERSDRTVTMREDKTPPSSQPRESPNVSKQTSEKQDIERKPEVPVAKSDSKTKKSVEFPAENTQRIDDPSDDRRSDKYVAKQSSSKKSMEVSHDSSQKINDLNEDGGSEKLMSKQSSSKSIGATTAGRSQHQNSSTFISPRDRLFGLSSEVHSFSSGLLEKTCDGILRAAKVGDIKTLRELHERGYSLLSIDANGQTALHVGARHGHKDIVRYVIACAPPTILNMIDNDKGQTALHKAAQQKRRSICCMLVAGGAALAIRDRHGNTPRELALAAEDRDLAAYLHSQEQFQLVTEDMENGP